MSPVDTTSPLASASASARNRVNGRVPPAGQAWVQFVIEHHALLLGMVLAGMAMLVGFQARLQDIWTLWLTDPLRSIGMLLPPAALFFAIRNSRREHWIQGNWWGLVLMAVLLALIGQAGANLNLSRLWAGRMLVISLTPTGLILWAYWSGTVLFFGGVRAWKAQRFPLALLLFVIPLPKLFSDLVDFPMQTLAAQVARGFASLIAVPVDGNALKMMFASDLGIFIAPGCDGLRGVATMAYLALLVGYYYRMRTARLAAYVAAAIVIAYVFNLLRLCCVIVYYWFALRIPAIGDYGTEIDYAIGGVLFFIAALFLFAVPRRGRPV